MRVDERLLQRLLGDLLHIDVEREANVVALRGVDGVDAVHDLARSVDLYALDAAVALEVGLEGLFGAVFAHDVARLVADAGGLLFQLGF